METKNAHKVKVFLHVASFLYLMLGGVLYVQAVTINTVGGQIKSDLITPEDKKTLGLDTGATQFLCTVSNKGCSDHITGLNPAFADCLAKFIKAGQAAGQSMRINSGYRSPARQAELFSAAVAKYGSESAARKSVAPPGGSNHGKGIAADLSNSGSWAHSNASKFGLNFRISHEPWHIEPGAGGCNSGTGAGNTNGQGGNNSQDQNGQGGQNGSGQSGSSGSGGDSGSGSGSGSPQQPSSTPTQSQPPQPPPQQLPAGGVEDAPDTASGASLTCTPNTIAVNDSSLLNWECPSGATSIKGGTSNSASLFNPKNALTGSLRVTPKKSTTYTATCLKSGRVLAKASCEVIVTEAKSTITARITASPKTVVEGETTDISWTSQNARSCVLTGPGIASANRSGRETSDALYENATFTLTCKPIKSTGAQLVKTVEVVVTGSDGQTQSQTSSTEQTEFVDPLK